jgi:crotonobetainyl-CoA:carnitine CoA-transferase CaiB-like acyl-CoA transferase
MGEYYMSNVVTKFSRTEESLSEAPSVGESTDWILERLGYDADERAAMRDESVVD